MILLGHFPYLNVTIVGNTRHDKRIVKIPRKVRHLVGVSAVNEHELRRFGAIDEHIDHASTTHAAVGGAGADTGQLRPCADACQVPHEYATVGRARREYEFTCRTPIDFIDLIGVSVEEVHTLLRFSIVPQFDDSVAVGCDKQMIDERIEREGIDFAVVCLRYAIGRPIVYSRIPQKHLREQERQNDCGRIEMACTEI